MCFARVFQENMLKEVMSGGVATPTSQSGEMMSVTTSGVDPFLGQANNTEPSHPRQNSADSGLGPYPTAFHSKLVIFKRPIFLTYQRPFGTGFLYKVLDFFWV